MEEQHNQWNGMMALGVGVGVLALLLLMAGNVIPVSKIFGSNEPGAPNADQLAAIPAPPEPIITDSGLFMYDTEKGDGAEAVKGATVSVHYTGTLGDGTPFDSSVGKEPLVFTIGNGDVIKGWDEGIVGMKVGGTRMLIVPPELAYGDAGAGPIPPGSILQFEVKLLSVNAPGEEVAPQ